MDFSWSPEQLEYKKAVIDFARKELKDNLIQKDIQSVFSKESWQKCAEFGILGLPIPKKYSGQGLDILTSVLMLESLGYVCRDNGLLFGMSAQMWDVQMPILIYGTEEQKKHYLPRLCNGSCIGAIAMTESGSGSDAFSISTTAEKKEDYYVLNGVKTFVTNGPVADLFLIFATVNKKMGFMGITAFLIDKDTPGIQVSKNIDKMGMRTNPWSEVVLDNCRIPEKNRLAKEGNGVMIFNESMEWERSCIMACFVGSMQRQIEECINYANDRKQFNKSIGKFQSVANKIVEMKVRLETAKLLLYRGAWSKNENKSMPMDAAMIKLHLSEAWISSSLDAIQIHGGYGYTTELEIERELRDSVSSTIFAGTSEIQKNIIAQKLGL